MKIIKRLQEYKEEKGLSYDYLSKIMGINFTIFSFLFNGKRTPSVCSIIKIIDFLKKQGIYTEDMGEDEELKRVLWRSIYRQVDYKKVPVNELFALYNYTDKSIKE